MYGDSNIEIYHTIRKIGSQGEFAVWLRELKWALRQTGGWGWDGDGREAWEGRDMGVPMADSDVWQKNTKFCKAIILKLNFF